MATMTMTGTKEHRKIAPIGAVVLAVAVAGLAGCCASRTSGSTAHAPARPGPGDADPGAAHEAPATPATHDTPAPADTHTPPTADHAAPPLLITPPLPPVTTEPPRRTTPPRASTASPTSRASG